MHFLLFIYLVKRVSDDFDVHLIQILLHNAVKEVGCWEKLSKMIKKYNKTCKHSSSRHVGISIVNMTMTVKVVSWTIIFLRAVKTFQ